MNDKLDELHLIYKMIGAYGFCTVKELLEKYDELQQKYNKALELLCEYNMPCEIDEFMDKNTDYCSRNCSVDDEVFKQCWNRFIEQKLEKSDKE